MKPQIKAGKRKHEDAVKKIVTEKQQESDDEDLLKEIEDDEADTTDDEGVENNFKSDDEDELSFESDEEGNYERIEKEVESEDDDDDEDEEEDEEEESDEEYEEEEAEDVSDAEELEEESSDEDSGAVENGDTEDDSIGEIEEVDLDNLLTKVEPKTKDSVKKAEKNHRVNDDSKSAVIVSNSKVDAKSTTKAPKQLKDASKSHTNNESSSKIKKQNKKLEPRAKALDANKNQTGQPKTDAPSEQDAKNAEKAKRVSKWAIRKLKSNLKQDAPVDDQDGDEYREDTSDEEDIRNTVGNIPMHWYDEYRHIGYDWDAKKIIKPPQGDQIDDFLKKIEDPNFWRTVKDPQTGQNVVLSDADIETIKRIVSNRYPDSNFEAFEPWVEWFTSEVEKMPIQNIPDHKRSFIPSRSEAKKVSRMVHALKMGWMKTEEELKKAKKAKKGPKFYMLWETDTGREQMRRIHDHVSAPKRDLPGHAESYNPPPEYLFDEKEMKEWHKYKDEPHKRKLHFIPQKFKSLREVPVYSRYVRERFLRCLDLYLCPRAKRTKLNIDAEYLIPKLPSPKDLQPFPTVESLVYRGHTDLVRTISVEPKGEYLVSGSDDMSVKIWEVATGRCIRTIPTGDIVRCVAWCPNAKLSIVAVASGNRLLLINPKVGDKMIVKKTDDLLAEAPKSDMMESERIKTAVQWGAPNKEEEDLGVRIVLTHFKQVRQVTWHGKGDYLATVMPEGANRSTLIHQLSKRRTQVPFARSKGLIQYVLFHPVKPCLFVATQHNIRIYDLVKQELIKKLLSNSKWISGMAIHPKGDNLLVSTYDKKMLWFDLDLSTKPYQTMRLHKNAVRNVSFHLRYPLFASASDDASVIVSHGMVYNDLLQNPLIVPLKKLQTHEQCEEFGVFDVVWHPMQPWVFSSGADTTVRLYT